MRTSVRVEVAAIQKLVKSENVTDAVHICGSGET